MDRRIKRDVLGGQKGMEGYNRTHLEEIHYCGMCLEDITRWEDMTELYLEEKRGWEDKMGCI